MIQLKTTDGNVISEAETFKNALIKANWDLRYVDLQDMDLSCRNLAKVHFTNSHLVRVNFKGANLHGACFSGASIHQCSFDKAHMGAVNFAAARLYDCDLSDVSMTNSSLIAADTVSHTKLSSTTRLPSGLYYDEFLELIVEAVLSQGKEIREVFNAEVWDCHDWNNCPMHVAFGARGVGEIPLQWRTLGHEFVNLFDFGMISLGDVEEAVQRLISQGRIPNPAFPANPPLSFDNMKPGTFIRHKETKTRLVVIEQGYTLGMGDFFWVIQEGKHHQMKLIELDQYELLPQ